VSSSRALPSHVVTGMDAPDRSDRRATTVKSTVKSTVVCNSPAHGGVGSAGDTVVDAELARAAMPVATKLGGRCRTERTAKP
jgi:hypothetical protein